MWTQKPDIVWFRIDSLRPEFLSAFGNEVGSTFLDELVKKGTSFTQCISAAPYTIASENATFTGFYPSVNKLDAWFKNSPGNLDRKVITFTDILKAEGYFTCCFYPLVARPYIAPYSFDIYEMGPRRHLININSRLLERYLSAASPKFLILNFFEIHDDCCANRGTYTKEKYHKSVLKVSEQVEHFYDKCCNEDALVVVSADHGVRVVDELSGAHHKDELVTGSYLTDKTIKTFFTVIARDKIPQGIEIKKMVRTIDIAPTILDAAGLAAMKAQGVSLLPYITKPEQTPELYAFSTTGGMFTSPWKPDTWSVRTPKWKMVVTKTRKHFFTNTSYKRELYNLEEDPYELENKIEEFPGVASELFIKIESVLLKNIKSVNDYYKESNFDQKKYLHRRFYPIEMRIKMIFYTLINYKLTSRLRTQFSILKSKIKRLVLK
ncbi:sulfatase [Candidatus Omnitrophota bacterium]